MSLIRLAGLQRAAPFGVQPGQNPQSAHFQWAWARDVKMPQAGVVLSREIYAPDNAGGADQAPKPLFRPNREKTSLGGRFSTWLGLGVSRINLGSRSG